MPAPVITLINFAPERISDPENFAGERAIFLPALPTFRTQSNALATYLNALPIQVRNNDWGLLVEPSDPSALVPIPPTQPTGGDTPAQRTVKSEDTVEATADLDTAQNLVGVYTDFFSSGSFVVDGARPVIPALTAPPQIGQSQATFEANAIAFFASVKAYAEKLRDLSTYFFNRIYPGPDEDYGSITDPVTSTASYGTVP